MNKCCEKCFTTHTEHDYPAHTTYDACINLSCPCHFQEKEEATTSDSEGRFDAKIHGWHGIHGSLVNEDEFFYSVAGMKDFIAKERTQAKKEGYAEGKAAGIEEATHGIL